MAKTCFKSVDDYIASQPDSAQAILESVRAVLRKALPRAEEVISYQIPVFKVDGSAVIYFAGWKAHFSLYPITEKAQAAFKDDLARYALSKGTVRFPLAKRIPATLIGKIAKFRAEEVAERARAKAAAPKKSKTKAAASKKKR
jgi:uncharacterized protein YdhG (YjbR/CyaY superfamily)